MTKHYSSSSDKNMKAYKAPSGNETWWQKSLSYSSINFPATKPPVVDFLTPPTI